MKKYNFIYLFIFITQVTFAQEDFFDDVIDDIVEPDVRINHFLYGGIAMGILIAFRLLHQMKNKRNVKKADSKTNLNQNLILKSN